ncbi:hypothetical protein R70211_05387 [Paraburkholderia domus]|uniref:EAL domain-containing protein n=2 Tax=Paraburkholderia domus TaxID=2793075 RepID=A0A9N8R2F0_9BURK|nr:hypothetical protein R70211_05387 [Paraburkholderia domus]
MESGAKMNSGSRLLVEVRNRGDILRVYGADFAMSMDRELVMRARELYGAQAQVRRVSDGRFQIAWEGVSPFGQIPGGRVGCAQSLLATLGERVKRMPGVAWLAELGAEWIGCDLPVQAGGVMLGEDLTVQAARDMEISEMVREAISEARFSIASQPVCNVEDPDLVLYRECLTRMHDREGCVVFPGSFIPSLERSGLIRWFDRYVVRRVISLLRERADLSLGVNISALSVVDDVLWESTLIDLLEAPDVARRLVFEITETAQLERGRGRFFANRLKQLGCRIAIDDFGAGYGVDTGIEIHSPDVVKIDGSFLSRAVEGEEKTSYLTRIVSLASDIAPLVVVEGVASEEDLQRVRGSGAVWAQGYYYGNQCSMPD